VDPQTFVGCNRLQFLHLNNNQIIQVDPQTFASCPALKWLYLEHNHLFQIAPETFASCLSLHTLDLKYNHLFQIAPETFASCLSLQYLYLQHNQLFQIAPETFASCLSLRTLDIRHNALLCEFASTTENSLKGFNAFSKYICRSPWAGFYKAVSEGNIPLSAASEHLQLLEDRNLIYEMVWLETKETAEREGRVFADGGDPKWGEDHVCDDRAIFYRALQRAVREKFNRLSAEHQRAVHARVTLIARENAGLAPNAPAWDPNWGESHREENVLRLIDAMEGL